ncbi:MAG TPA: sulfolactaldehyde 3-reductase [Alphaproteobacteria bacterium]|nr:sulfolactaldehyde 3-reductase [Alphaproteobacteria bacterium]
MKTIGFIGVGVMGAPMARNLLKGGYGLRVFDINAAAMEALKQNGASPSRSPAEAANGADAVITMLPNGEHVEEALFGKDGAASAMAKGTLYIDMSTIAPTVTDRIAKRLAEQGIDVIDAPVGRTSQHAVDGKLLIMAGGSDAALARARPILERMGDTIVHCGPVGSGARVKIVNNYMAIVANTITAEALTLAEASGVDPELARKVMLGTTAGMGHMSTTYPAKVLKGDLAPGFMVDLAAKDLGLAIEFARTLGAPVATGETAREVYERAKKAGRGRQDWTAIYAMTRESLGR